MLALFLVAAATGVLTYSLLWRRLERRDTALAVRRLAARVDRKRDRGPSAVRASSKPPARCAAC